MRGELFLIAVVFLPLAVKAADFIESVHAQGAKIAKEMVVDGSQVVWSPFSVVNVLPLINGDESLKTGFKEAIQHFKDVEGLEIARLTSAFVKNVPEVEALGTEYGVEVSEFPFNGTGEPLEEAYQEAFAMDPPLGLIPESVDGFNQVFLTSLLVKAKWENSFMYAPSGRFFMNETHAAKARFMYSVGTYGYGSIPGVDAHVLSVPFENCSTTSLVLVVPYNSSALSVVSEQFAGVQVGNITQYLKETKMHLTLPKISIDSQLFLQPSPDVQIVHSGSIRFSYKGVNNRVSKLRGKRRFNRGGEKRKFKVNRPFIFMIFDTQAGVLNYGEVLLPTYYKENIPIVKAQASPPRLSLNARLLSETNHERGNEIFQKLKLQLENFAISPITFANLLASYATIAGPNVQELLFPAINSKMGMMELYESINYFNTTTSNCTKIDGGNEVLAEKVNDLGTKVTFNQTETTSGSTDFKYEVQLRPIKYYFRKFYHNERDSQKLTFYEYIGKVKYVSLSVYDAKAVLINLSPKQSLLLFIPNQRSGLHLVEDGLQSLSIHELFCQRKERYVRLRLPNFFVNTTADLLPTLNEILGVNQIMIEGLGRSIQKLEHNVQIKVTGNMHGRGPGGFNSHRYTGSQVKVATRIKVDRPFIFYLLDKFGGTLAVGRVTKFPVDEEEVSTSPSPVAPTETKTSAP